MSDLATLFFLNVPTVLPLVAAAMAICLATVLGILVLVIRVIASKSFRQVTINGGGETGRSPATMIFLVSVPGFGSFFGDSFALVVTGIDDLANSVGQLLSGDIFRLVAAVVLAVFAGYVLRHHDVAAQQWAIFHTCTFNDIVDWVKEILNLVRFGAGTVWPGSVNPFMFFTHGLLHIVIRVVRDCTLENEPWTVITNVFVHLGTAIREFFSALGDFFAAGDLLHGRPDFVPAFTALGDVPSGTGEILNCTCAYLGGPIESLLEVTQDPTFARTLDCAANAVIRAVQEVWAKIVTPQN